MDEFEKYVATLSVEARLSGVPHQQRAHQVQRMRHGGPGEVGRLRDDY